MPVIEIEDDDDVFPDEDPDPAATVRERHPRLNPSSGLDTPSTPPSRLFVGCQPLTRNRRLTNPAPRSHFTQAQLYMSQLESYATQTNVMKLSEEVRLPVLGSNSRTKI